jgi:DNA-binding NarL/FixJ family response regulator
MDKTRVLLADDHAVVRAGIGKALGELDNLEIIEEVGIARAMSISVKMVENHLTRLYRQLGVSSRLEAMAYVVAHPEVLAVTGKAAQTDLAPLVKDTVLCVLLVDDNTRYRGQLRRMMGKACAQSLIYEADGVKEALRLVGQHPIQLALVDVVLGHDSESGIQCARRLRALDPQMRIVLISAYPDREFHRQGLEAGAVAFLDKKDLDVPTLRQVVDDITASSAP